MRIQLIAAVLLASSIFSAHAAAVLPVKQPLTVALSTKKIFVEKKKESKLEVSRAELGDVIEFTLTYQNSSAQPVYSVKAALPIPDGYDYIEKTAIPAITTAPLNGILVWNVGSLKPKETKAVVARLILKRIPKLLEPTP